MSKKKEETTDLVPTQEAGDLALMSDMENDAGMGFENIGADDMAIPFILILQSGSPQLKRGEQKIDGAEEGDVFNSVTNAVYPGGEGIYVIPCAYRKAYVEWTLREDGGGFVMQHDDVSILENTRKDDKNRDILPNGHSIVTTAYHYVLLVDPLTGNYEEAVISMTSTQLKKSRKWNKVMDSIKMTRRDGSKFKPPMFSHVYHLTTVPEKNEQGQWCGWLIETHGVVGTADWYQAAKDFAAAINRGDVKTVPPAQETEDETPEAF